MKKLMKSLEKYRKLNPKDLDHENIDHFFVLTRLNKSCHFQNIAVDFSPQEDQSYSLEEGEPTFPVFNKDKNHFTKTFILPKERDFCLSKPKKLRDKFQEKIDKKLAQIEEKQYNSFDVVSPDVKYCQICKYKFENYHEHIQSRTHKHQIFMTEGQKYIHQIIKYTKKINEKAESFKKENGKKTKKISKQVHKEKKSSKNALKSPKTTISKSK